MSEIKKRSERIREKGRKGLREIDIKQLCLVNFFILVLLKKEEKNHFLSLQTIF